MASFKQQHWLPHSLLSQKVISCMFYCAIYRHVLFLPDLLTVSDCNISQGIRLYIGSLTYVNNWRAVLHLAFLDRISPLRQTSPHKCEASENCWKAARPTVQWGASRISISHLQVVGFLLHATCLYEIYLASPELGQH